MFRLKTLYSLLDHISNPYVVRKQKLKEMIHGVETKNLKDRSAMIMEQQF